MSNDPVLPAEVWDDPDITKTVVPAEYFDALVAELDEPPRVDPELRARLRRHRDAVRIIQE